MGGSQSGNARRFEGREDIDRSKEVEDGGVISQNPNP